MNDGFEIQFFRGVSIMKAPHIHEKYELYFCPDDIEQSFVICGTEQKYKGPCAIISRPYTIHSMSCLEDCPTDYTRYVFYFDNKVISELGESFFPDSILNEKMSLLFRLTPEEAENIAFLVENGIEKTDTVGKRENLLLFALVLNRLFRFCNPERIDELGNSSYYVEEVMKYVSEHFAEEIDVYTLASKFAVSRSKLDRDFKSAIGVTPKLFIEECRLNNAKNLLININEKSVSEIASNCGFTSENYFYRFFKKKTGLSPVKYKRMNKKGN